MISCLGILKRRCKVKVIYLICKMLRIKKLECCYGWNILVAEKEFGKDEKLENVEKVKH